LPLCEINGKKTQTKPTVAMDRIPFSNQEVPTKNPLNLREIRGRKEGKLKFKKKKQNYNKRTLIFFEAMYITHQPQKN